LDITDNETRLEILPVLLHNDVNFRDSVYERLAKTDKTTIGFYNILAEAKQLQKFPMQYRSQKQFVVAKIKSMESRYATVDSVVYLDVKKLQLGKQSYLMYIYKYRLEESDNWYMYNSDPMPTDTTMLLSEKDVYPFYGQSAGITEENTTEKLIDDLLFDTYMK
jgi:hypothetical protein